MRRLIRFLHGGPAFVQSSRDFEEALRVADYLGMAAVCAQCNVFIAEHLEVKTASQLWSYLESQPRLHLEWHQDPIFNEEVFVDADDACAWPKKDKHCLT